ncbi:hypothetical protein OG729_38290 [Streptomyces sp. NBC_00210]|uniref:hypothetical protein n=1 Tax=unclassified Streptomyces TaxID=2593676 RepID=UPI00325028B5
MESGQADGGVVSVHAFDDQLVAAIGTFRVATLCKDPEMSSPRTMRPLLSAVLLSLAAGCSSNAPEAPPPYKLDGDACGVVPTDTPAAFTASSPVKRSSDLTQGLQGGNCEMDFDGTGGSLKLATFIAIHPTGEAAAKEMFDKFKTSDTAAVDSDTTVSDLKDLGSVAYVRRQYYGSQPWKPTDVSLYKIVVQHGSLVLSCTSSGFAKTPASWPATDQELQAKLKENAKQIMTKLAG